MLLMIEGIAWIGSWWLEEHKDVVFDPMEFKGMPSHQRRAVDRLMNEETRTTEFSASLGWVPKKNVDEEDGRFVTNSIGIRHNREFSAELPGQKVRISTFGDSFTAGIGVSNAETWQEQMMGLNENLEVLNFGVGGFGTDQAYLRSRENPLDQHISVMGYLTENLHRVVSVYVPYYMGPRAHMPVTKPRFLIENDELVLEPNPIQDKSGYQVLIDDYKQSLISFGEHDNYFHEFYFSGPFDFLRTVRLAKIGWSHFTRKPIYHRGQYDVNSEAFRVVTGVFKKFRDDALANGSLPVVVVFPTYPNMVHKHRHDFKNYVPLLEWFDDNGFIYVDLMPGLFERKGDYKIVEMFKKDLHYNEVGHRLTAETLIEFVKEKRLEDAGVRKQLMEGMKAAQ